MAPPDVPEPLALPVLVQQAPREAVRELPADVLKLLYRQMRVLAGPRSDLDDLVQAAAVRLIRALPRFEQRSSLSTFAYGVAYRTLLGHDRWYRRWSRRFSLTEEGERDELAPEETETAEQSALRARRASSLHRALAQLPATKRAVIVLHDLEELEMKEVAAIVDTNERTVRSRLRDGRKKLATLLADDPAFEREAP
jgi:RNA polymerase sigma-70 factor (ECF subfamily)